MDNEKLVEALTTALRTIQREAQLKNDLSEGRMELLIEKRSHPNPTFTWEEVEDYGGAQYQAGEAHGARWAATVLIEALQKNIP